MLIMDVETFVAQIDDIDYKSFVDEAARREALGAAYALASRLESPWDTNLRIAIGQPAVTACLMACIDLDLFAKWKQSGTERQSIEQLAKLVGAEQDLLDRILKHLCAHHVVAMPEPQQFSMTRYSEALASPLDAAWIKYLHYTSSLVYNELPSFLKDTGYCSPRDSANGVFQRAKSCSGSVFDYFGVHAEERRIYDNLLSSIARYRSSWLDVYPAARLLSLPEGFDDAASNTLLVDVGGSTGTDVEAFRSRYPAQAHRLVLQDREEVLRNTLCKPPVQVVAHDFFQRQPVEGARAYYLRGVLHDWPDEQALEILGNLKAAMTRGYSLLLINEHVVDDTGERRPDRETTAYDIEMMVMVSGKERTEVEWKTLLSRAGFRILNIWSSAYAAQKIIEASIE